MALRAPAAATRTTTKHSAARTKYLSVKRRVDAERRDASVDDAAACVQHEWKQKASAPGVRAGHDVVPPKFPLFLLAAAAENVSPLTE